MGAAIAAGLVALLGSLTAASLIYVGVHYLSDVLAALARSLAWLSLLRLALPPALPKSAAPIPPHPIPPP
jgi:membrane-associated phospholipid phosphatase